MFQDIKNDEFREFCRTSSDIEGMLRLVREGADPNLRDRNGDSYIGEAVADYVVYGSRDEDDDSPTDTQATVARAMEYVREAAALGWDTRRFGSEVMARVAYSLDRFTFEFLRFMLHAGVEVSDDSDGGLLDVLGTEESYQRCVEEDHDSENLLYAAYEMVLAATKGQDFDTIVPFSCAEGMHIGRIICLRDPHFTPREDGATEFDGDIGFVSGDRMLVVRGCLNVLFMNGRIGEMPQRDGCDLFGPGVVGSVVRDIAFTHRNVRRKDGDCGQPTLTLTLDNGKKLRFTHNFGENGDEPVQARFWVE